MTLRLLPCLLLAAAAAPLAAQTCPAGNPRVALDARYDLSVADVVTDTVTGLMWKRCPEGRSGAVCATGSITIMSWSNALNAADAANTASHAGYNDWRLPNSIELESLVETGCLNPAINTNAFPQNGTNAYWSSTTFAPGASNAMFVAFSGGALSAAGKNSSSAVRLVRGGQWLDPLDIIFADGFEAGTALLTVP